MKCNERLPLLFWRLSSFEAEVDIFFCEDIRKTEEEREKEKKITSLESLITSSPPPPLSFCGGGLLCVVVWRPGKRFANYQSLRLSEFIWQVLPQNGQINLYKVSFVLESVGKFGYSDSTKERKGKRNNAAAADAS